jgi:CRP/FNR family transcriptional regulator
LLPQVKLPRASAARWRDAWKSNTYRRGDVLFYEGNEPMGLHCLCSGRVKLTRTDCAGRQMIVRIVVDAGLLGERALIVGNAYEATATVADDARVCFIPAARFHAMWDADPAISRALAVVLAVRLGEAQDLCAEIGLLTIRERLARLIARASEAGGAGSLADLGATRLELAERLATSPEVVCRAMADLEASGLIASKGRFTQVLDARRLRAAARLPAGPIDFYQDARRLSSSRPRLPVMHNTS